MSDIHALTGAYAVDALDELERARFERHLAECADCRAEVEGLRGAATLMAETSALEPPPALRTRVLSEIATVRPLPPASGSPSSGASTRRRRLLTSLVAAAAVVVALAAGAVAWHPWSSETPPPTAIERVLDAPDAQRVTQRIAGDGQATLVRSRSMNQAVLLTKDMPAPPEGKVYELWLQDAHDTMVPAGLMPDGATQVLLQGDATHAVGAGITVEPAGGSKAPTSDPVLLFDLENA